MIQKKVKGLERMEVLSTSQVFLGNKYISYIHTARNAQTKKKKKLKKFHRIC